MKNAGHYAKLRVVSKKYGWKRACKLIYIQFPFVRPGGQELSRVRPRCYITIKRVALTHPFYLFNGW